MLNLFSFCDCHWMIPWLLPFLLGLGLGWLLWAHYKKYKGMYEDSQKENKKLSGKISRLEEDFADCRKRRAELEGDLALAKGRTREMERDLELAKKVNDLGASGFVANSSSLSADRSHTKDVSDKNKNIAQGVGESSDEIRKNDSAGSNKIDDSLSLTSNQGKKVTPIAPMSSAKADKYSALKSDNLQIIEGIGPKMESICKENGMGNWGALASKSPNDLNAMLGKYGDRYRIIDPESWPEQAAFARDGKWDELIAFQKGIGGQGETDAKAEKVMIKLGIIKKWKQDDLKAVEGIGPKIAELLGKEGINTWRELSNTNVSKIQDILNAAGSRYKLADPGSWPKQAGFAADGKWDDLEAYQEELDGGK